MANNPNPSLMGEERAREVLAFTDHSPECVGNMSDWDKALFTGNELLEMGECDCNREIRAMLAFAEEARVAERASGPRYRHKARGTEYEVISDAELQDATGNGVEEGAILTIYRGDDGKIWARRASEFGDGRFERIATAIRKPAK